MDSRDVIEMPEPQYVMSAEGYRIATYSWGDDADPTVLLVHGFASNAHDNWVATGWVRDLHDAGYRVLAVDQRGHGASDRPHDPHEYSMAALANDLIIALDTYLVSEAAYVGYSLGGRVGWHLMSHSPEHISIGVLGGIPDGQPLRQLQLDQARAFVATGEPVTDTTTRRYMQLIGRLDSNDKTALLALAEGMRLADDPSPSEHPPLQPTLIATGTKDAILEDSRVLAAELSDGELFEIPDRGHIDAPVSREFRRAGIEFLRARG